MGSKRTRAEDKAAADMRDLIAGIRPVRSVAERIRLRSWQLHEELKDVRSAPGRPRRPDRS